MTIIIVIIIIITIIIIIVSGDPKEKPRTPRKRAGPQWID